MHRTKGFVALALAAGMAAPLAQAEIFTNEKGERVECRDEVVNNGRQGVNPTVGAIGGAVAGGVLGHQIGGGRGQDIATAGGAVAGGMAGKRMAENSGGGQQQTVTQRVCRPLG
ncbi:MAG TPA: glycine zipper 2TM domain-containing protein [Solimonas sp.]